MCCSIWPVTTCFFVVQFDLEMHFLWYMYQIKNILDSFKLKIFADDKLMAVKITLNDLEKVEDVVGNEEKCSILAFSPFPKMF